MNRIKTKIVFLILLFLGLAFSSCDPKLYPVLFIKADIIEHPSDKTVNEGESVSFQVIASGTKPIEFQWYKNNEKIDGATDSIFTILSTTFQNNGELYTVSVSNNEEQMMSSPALLTVIKYQTPVISFTTEGSKFEPVIEIEGTADILWTWSDGTQSSSATPSIDFGTTASRKHTLLVTPWSAVKNIIIGFDAQDGGSNSITKVPDQNVSKVEGLELVAPYLEIWCSSYNKIKSLDFSNFIKLKTIECFNSVLLENLTLTNTPLLERLCVEDCNLYALDLSQKMAFQDIRGALNNYTTINFGTIGANVWHICIRDNPQFTNQHLFQDMTQYPEITDFLIWNDNQAGSLRIPSTGTERGVFIEADDNHYTSIDLSGAMQGILAGTVSFKNNEITNVTITGCVQINELDLENNNINQAEADEILATMDGLGRSRNETPEYLDLTINLAGNEVPSSTGYTNALNLQAKGWKIITDSWVLNP